MKRLFTKILLTGLFTLFVTFAKAQALDEVVNGVRNGNIAQISRYFDNVVVITIGNNQSTYSKTQGEMVLKDFFNKNVPRSFNLLQGGNAPGNNTNKFAIGNLTTNNGNYQVYVLLKLKDGSYYLQEIRFER